MCPQGKNEEDKTSLEASLDAMTVEAMVEQGSWGYRQSFAKKVLEIRSEFYGGDAAQGGATSEATLEPAADLPSPDPEGAEEHAESEEATDDGAAAKEENSQRHS